MTRVKQRHLAIECVIYQPRIIGAGGVFRPNLLLAIAAVQTLLFGVPPGADLHLCNQIQYSVLGTDTL